MALLLVLVFTGVFALIALPLGAAVLFPSSSARQAMQSLDSAIKAEILDASAQVVDLRKTDIVSSIPWLNRRLAKLEVVPHVSQVLSQASMSWTPGRLLSVCAFGFAIPSWALFARFHSLPVALGAGVGFGIVPYAVVMLKRKRRFHQFEEHLPEALDMMVSALRAGHSLVAAMSLVGKECAEPVGSELRICFDEQNYGLEMKEAFDNLLRRIPLQDLKIVATAIMIQKESGGNLAEVLDKTSHVIRERFRLKRQIRVHTASGRLTGWILTLVPAFLGIGMYFVNPAMMSILWTRQIGIDLMWAAGSLTVIGGFIIQRIVGMEA